MRIFVAGGSGVIGVRLVRRLVAEGHAVAAMTRTASKAPMLQDLGADAVVCDVFDADALNAVVRDFGPDVVIHELTDLPDDESRIGERAASHARVRREGTRNLVLAAESAGADGFLAQSVAWDLGGDGAAAVRELERLVIAANGVVLRYGRFYGPGTYHPHGLPEPPRVHIDDAARRTVDAIGSPSGVVTIAEP